MKTLLLALLLSLPSYASAQVLATIPVMGNGNHDAHDYSFGPVLVPAQATIARVVFQDADGLKGDNTITVVVDRSFNGGGNYELAISQAFDSITPPVDVIASLVAPTPQTPTSTRVIQGRVTLFGGKWKGKAFVEIE